MRSDDARKLVEWPAQDLPNIALWSENFFLSAIDPQQHICVLCHIGRWHADPTVWRELVMVAFPDGTLLLAKNFGKATNGPVVSASLARIEVIEAEKTYDLHFDGPVWIQSGEDLALNGLQGGTTKRLKLNLRCKAVTPTWDMVNIGDASAGKVPDQTFISGLHVEQRLRADGRLEFDGRELTLSGAHSVRDHSRGPRDCTHFRSHVWTQCDFPSGRSFFVYKVAVDKAGTPAEILHAVIMQDGRQYPATIEQADYASSVDERGQPGVLILRSELGKMNVAVTPIATMTFTFKAPWTMDFGALRGDRHVFSLEQPSRFEWNGEVGYGQWERAFARNS